MKSSLRVWVMATVVLLVALLGCQQSAKAVKGDASKVAEQAFAAMSTSDWAAYSKLLHAGALNDFRQMVLPAVEAALPPAPSDSLTQTLSDSVTIFGQKLSLGDLRQQSPDQFFSTILNVVFGSVPQLKQTFESMKNTVVGEVPEGDTLVHVLVRTQMTMGGASSTEMDVLSVRHEGSDWKLLLSSKMRGMAQLIQQVLTMRQG